MAFGTGYPFPTPRSDEKSELRGFHFYPSRCYNLVVLLK